MSTSVVFAKVYQFMDCFRPIFDTSFARSQIVFEPFLHHFATLRCDPGGTVNSGGLPPDTFVLRFSKTHHVFRHSGGNPAHLSALPRFDCEKFQYLPATFAILGGNPGYPPPGSVREALQYFGFAFNQCRDVSNGLGGGGTR